MSIGDYPEGHLFTEEGKYGNAMYLVIEGEVSVTQRNPEGNGSRLLKKIGPGEVFGLIALIDHGSRSATCQAAGPTRIASLPQSAFSLLYRLHAHLAYRFQYLVARQLVRDARNVNRILYEAVRKEKKSNLSDDLPSIYTEYRVD